MILDVSKDAPPTFTRVVDEVEYTVTFVCRPVLDPTHISNGEFRITGPGTFAAKASSFDWIDRVIRSEVNKRAEKARQAKAARDRRAGKLAAVPEPLPAYLSDGTRITVRGLHASRPNIALITRPDKRTKQPVADEAGKHEIVRDLTVAERDEFKALADTEQSARKARDASGAVARRIADPEVKRLMTGRAEVTFDPSTGTFSTVVDGMTYTGETITEVSNAVNAVQVAAVYPYTMSSTGAVAPLTGSNFSGYERVGTEAEAFAFQGDHAVWVEARHALDAWVKAHVFDFTIYDVPGE